MFDYTDVDGIMIGRAALGNPWIFKSIIEGLNKYEKNEKLENQIEYIPTNKERLSIILEHINLAIQEKGEFIAIREMRKHISGYTKKLPNSSIFRERMNKIENKNELIQFIQNYINEM